VGGGGGFGGGEGDIEGLAGRGIAGVVVVGFFAVYERTEFDSFFVFVRHCEVKGRRTMMSMSINLASLHLK
jgi:hypothetical protein